MRYAISADGEEVAPHFGRCEYYALVDVEDGKIVERQRISSPGHNPGQLPQMMVQHQVNCVVAGGAGPMAQNMFAEMGIAMILGVSGPLDDTIAKIAGGELEAGEDGCVHTQ